MSNISEEERETHILIPNKTSYFFGTFKVIN
jgi:hypothetical protein